MAKRKQPVRYQATIIDRHTGHAERRLVDAKDILLPSRKRHPSLTEEQVQRAKALWGRIARSALPELDEATWVEGFCMEQFIDVELSIWERIADVWERVRHDPAIRKHDPTDAAQAVVSILSGLMDVPSHHGVSKDFVTLVRRAAADVHATASL